MLLKGTLINSTKLLSLTVHHIKSFTLAVICWLHVFSVTSCFFNHVCFRAEKLVDQYRKKATLYKGNVVLIPLGDDFRYEMKFETTEQFSNYQVSERLVTNFSTIYMTYMCEKDRCINQHLLCLKKSMVIYKVSALANN